MKKIKMYIKNQLFYEKFISIECRRINGGYCSHAFIINFTRSKIYVETNIRVRNNSRILLNFNDIWIDKERNELSDEKFDKMTNIENSFLCCELEEVNKSCKNIYTKSILLKEYGDLIIHLENGVVIEIINDTHLENAIVYSFEDLTSDKTILFQIKDLLPVSSIIDM